MKMEKAIILGKIKYRASSNFIEKIKSIHGVTGANIIFGPYDFYATISIESKEKLSDVTCQIRSNEGVLDTMTCYVVSLSDIRPEAIFE